MGCLEGCCLHPKENEAKELENQRTESDSSLNEHQNKKKNKE